MKILLSGGGKSKRVEYEALKEELNNQYEKYKEKINNRIIYRKATLDDAYGIEFVSTYSWRETYYDLMPNDYLDNRVLNIDNRVIKTRKFLENNDNYYVAELDGKIIGILHHEKSKETRFQNYGHLNAIYVLKNYQGLGIGKELFKIALQRIIDLGYNDMYLECLKGNKSIKFYQKYNGKIIDTIDYQIENFVVKVDIIEFNNLKSVLEVLT